jgi:Lipocalin-like domain
MQRFSFFLVFTLLFSCKSEDKTTEILGTWQGVAWSVAGKETNRADQEIQFVFSPDKTYAATYGAQKEMGNFRMEGQKLYTTAQNSNKIEKVVMLSRITPDTILMDMNRTGQVEQLVLVRK